MVTTGKAPGVLGIPGARYLQPGEQAQNFPSPLQYMGSNLKKNYPEIAANTAASLMPGGPLARIVTAAGVTGAGNAIQGNDPIKAAVRGGLAQMGGEAIGKGVQIAAQGVLRNKFIEDTMRKLAGHMKDIVPTFKNFPTSIKGVIQMFYDTRGNNQIHRYFDDAMQAIVRRGETKDIQVPKWVAEELGIPTKKGGVQSGSAAQKPTFDRVPEEQVLVNAADAAEAAVGKWEKRPGAYRAVQAILDANNIGDQAARNAYKTYMGTKEYFNSVGAFEGEKFLPEKAMAGLTTEKADILLGRNLGEIMKILKPEGQLPLEKKDFSGLGMALGAGAGSLSGMGFGPLGHGAGAAGGGYLGMKIGGKIPRYVNVPLPEGMIGGQQAAASSLGGVGSMRVKPLTTTTSSNE